MWARQTSSRGASKTRSMRISRGAGVVTCERARRLGLDLPQWCTHVCDPFCLLQELAEPVEPRFQQLPGTWRSRSSRRPAGAGRSLQWRTRPTFSVVTSPACSRTATCFLTPVRLMPKVAASSLIVASRRAEDFQDAPAGRIGESREGGIELGGILNHMVQYFAGIVIRKRASAPSPPSHASRTVSC